MGEKRQMHHHCTSHTGQKLSLSLWFIPYALSQLMFCLINKIKSLTVLLFFPGALSNLPAIKVYHISCTVKIRKNSGNCGNNIKMCNDKVIWIKTEKQCCWIIWVMANVCSSWMNQHPLHSCNLGSCVTPSSSLFMIYCVQQEYFGRGKWCFYSFQSLWDDWFTLNQSFYVHCIKNIVLIMKF